MKKKVQTTVAGLLVTAAVGGGIAWAQGLTKTIDVTYDNIKIMLDGQLVEPKDANGKTVEPFIYEGTTYLPVRAVGNAIGKEVSWDGIEKVVYLGAKPGSTESWLNVCGPYQYGGGKEYRVEKNEYFTMSGKKYTNGFRLGPGDSRRLDGKEIQTEALFNLDGKYNSLNFAVGHIDGSHNNNSTLNIYLDGVIAYTTTLKYDDVAKKITVPLNGALQMKIELSAHGGYYGFSEGKFE